MRRGGGGEKVIFLTPPIPIFYLDIDFGSLVILPTLALMGSLGGGGSGGKVAKSKGCCKDRGKGGKGEETKKAKCRVLCVKEKEGIGPCIEKAREAKNT